MAEDIPTGWMPGTHDFGVLTMQPNVTKAFVTTTSTFAPGIYDEFEDLIPNRLVLRNGEEVNQWLTEIQNK